LRRTPIHRRSKLARDEAGKFNIDVTWWVKRPTLVLLGEPSMALAPIIVRAAYVISIQLNIDQ
jgi:ABC-type branched-subunit amino acid transport system ATPase component